METTTELRAFHGDPKIKSKYLRRVRAHAKADELVKGATGQDGKGCAVWCTLNKYEHDCYETELGILEQLAWLEDTIFENLPDAESATWPDRFLKAIPVGADLSRIIPQLVIWQFEDSQWGLAQTEEVKQNPELALICSDLVALYRRASEGQTVNLTEWRSVEDRAWARARARAGARAGAWARARAGAGAWARARAGAHTEAQCYSAISHKLLELLAAAPIK